MTGVQTCALPIFILVTGPTGSGKTTTLYSTLKQVATPEVNVCTIEDPIEMIEPAFNQMQVQSAIDQLKASSTVYQDFVSSIQDVDMAEALARLNQNQTALQANYQMTAQLNQLSLLNFLPN